MRTLETDATKIAYQIGGKKEGEKLVLIHGLYVNSDCWKNQISFFEKDFNVLRFDLHGHGRSIKPGKRFSINDYVKDMSILLNHLGWDSELNIVGHSLGGLVALSYSLENSACVKRLVIASSYCEVPAGAVAIVIESIKRNGVERFSLGVGRRGLSTYDKDTARWIASLMTDHLTKNDLILASYASEGINLCKALKKIEIPALIIVGEDDDTTPVKASEEMHKQLPQSELVIVEEANHLVIIDHSNLFNETVKDFLNQP